MESGPYRTRNDKTLVEIPTKELTVSERVADNADTKKLRKRDEKESGSVIIPDELHMQFMPFVMLLL